MDNQTEQRKAPTERETLSQVFVLHAVLNATMISFAVNHGIINEKQGLILAEMTDAASQHYMEHLFPNGSDNIDVERLKEMQAKGRQNATIPHGVTLNCGTSENVDGGPTFDVAGPQPAREVDEMDPETWEKPQTREELDALIDPYAKLLSRLGALATASGKLRFEEGIAIMRGFDRAYTALADRMFPETDGENA